MPRYIDADALKDVIQQHDYPLSDKLNSIGNGMFTLGIFQAIDQMPTVSLDEVRGVGKWIPLDYSDEAYGNMYKCAKCGCSEIGEPNYCPNCGAKMEVQDG